MSTKIVTGKARFSYVNVFEPTSMDEGQEKKYNLSILIPKSDKATMAKIHAAIEEATQQGLTSKFGGKKPATLKNPLRDGDIEKPEDDTYAGHFFINAKSTRKPQIVDANLDPIMSQEEFYSGCYGRASITFYAYATAGSKGIAAGLENLQKLEDGERLGGGSSSAAEDFGDDLM
jgi:hypothetical protein